MNILTSFKCEFNTVEVQHNVEVKERSNVKHQIDVDLEFEMVDAKYKVAIECKNFTSDITLERISDFYYVDQDICNIYGIIVTKAGFQSGVKEYAKHHEMGLKLL